MFDVVVKNTILFTMFILAIHFLIKSRLLDEGFVVSPSMPGTVGMPFAPAPAPAPMLAPTPSLAPNAKLQELHDYVFAEDEKTLDDYFKTPAVPPKHDTVPCNAQSMPTLAPAAKDLCASNVDKQFDLTNKGPIMENNHSFYKAYPNESVLNGGLMGNIMGFSREREYEQL
jgi:hypothetical protein